MTKEESITWERQITIGIFNLKVDKRYYSFDYNYFIYNDNGKKGVICNSGSIDSSHSRGVRTMKKLLKDGYAVELVLEKELLR